MTIKRCRWQQAVVQAQCMLSVALTTPLLLAACSSSRPSLTPSVGMRQATYPAPKPLTHAEPNRQASHGGGYKLGQPYSIGGIWYVPREDPTYDRTGVGSWYGADFNGKTTANGEIYNMDSLTAAHPTLPIPSYVIVTNLGNNRTVMLRVNDRGPYVGGRMIDLSRAAARALGYETMGTAHLRVQYVGRAPLNGDESRERRYLASQPWSHDEVAHNQEALPVWQPRSSPYPPSEPGAPNPNAAWSPDAYRRSRSTMPSPPTPKLTPSSWLPSWGLGSIAN